MKKRAWVGLVLGLAACGNSTAGNLDGGNTRTDAGPGDAFMPTGTPITAD